MARPEKPSRKSVTPESPVRRNRARPIGVDTGELGRAAFDRAGFAEPGLVLRWNEIVGPEVARIARPLKLTDGASGGVLTLKADSAAALFLQHESRALCARVNAYLGRPAVQRLRFVPGEIACWAEPPPSRESTPDASPHDPARQFAGEDRLRNALLSLAKARRGKGPGE
jgi:hypothetical protein